MLRHAESLGVSVRSSEEEGRKDGRKKEAELEE